MEKKLYPLKFEPVAGVKPWGGNALVKEFGKSFIECDEEGNEVSLGEDVKIGESWELADMGFEDSVVEEGWLAGNSISDVMETYLERVVGEQVYNSYGRQFPVLIKYLNVEGKMSVHVHPDDEIAAERYDSLGKSEMWYIVDAKPGAKVYMGFNKAMTAQELYDRCISGTIEEVLNVIYPKKGDVFHIKPGTVHAAEGGLLIADVQESSDMSFRLYDWGRESDPETARPMHLEEAIDMIDYSAFDESLYHSVHECKDEHHDHGPVDALVESPQFNVTKLNLADPLHIYTEKFDSFIIYMCIEGAASVQIPSTKEDGEAYMDNYEFKKGETILVPADMPDFYLVPRDRKTVLLEVVTRPQDEVDDYIDPSTEAFLENEDYEGLEDGVFDDEPAGQKGASPLNFFS